MNWNSRSPPASTRRCSTPRRGQLLEHPGDRQVAAFAGPALGFGRQRPAGERSRPGQQQRPGRRLGEEVGVERQVERAADDHVPRPAAQPRPIGGVGQRRMRPVAKGRAADQHRVGLGAQPAHARMVALAAEEGEAAFARVDAPVERDRGVADDLHRPRVICTPAHSRPCTGGRFFTETVTWCTSGFLSATSASSSATRSISRYSRPCTASIMSPARR